MKIWNNEQGNILHNIKHYSVIRSPKCFKAQCPSSLMVEEGFRETRLQQSNSLPNCQRNCHMSSNQLILNANWECNRELGNTNDNLKLKWKRKYFT